MSVVVVVVTYDSADSLPAFLDSLEAASCEQVDVVIADNGSSDGSAELAATRPGVRLLPTGGNLGYGRAANAGVESSTGEWVVIANPDIVWQPGSIDELLAAGRRWPRAGSLGPLIRTGAGEVYPSARALPSLRHGIGHALLGWWWPGNPWTAAYRAERDAPREREAGWLSGSCLLLRRRAFEQVSGFDPSYFMYFEDVDLGQRLGLRGWQNVYVPSAQVIHTGGHATSRHKSRMAAEHHRSAWQYLSRQYAGWRWLPVRAVIKVGLVARELLSRRVSGVSSAAALRRPSEGNEQ